jgi:hypothetical protein
MVTTAHPQLSGLLDGLYGARPAYDEAQSFYDGRVEEVFYSQKLADIFKATGRHYRVNYARTPVDVLLERTSIQGVTCSDNGQLNRIQQVIDDNELGIEAKDVHRRAYEYGDSYLIAWPADPEEFPGGVEVYGHDPQQVRVFYSTEQPRRKVAALHGWVEQFDGDILPGAGGAYFHRVNVYLPDEVQQWVSYDAVFDVDGLATGARLDKDTQYRPFVSDDSDENGVILNPTPGVIPVFHFRTARQYGRPEHADAYGPQNGINKLVTNLLGTVDYATLPQRYALLEDSAQRMGSPSPSALFIDDGTIDQEAQDSYDPGRADLGSEPGDVWLLGGVKAVGQFAAADTKNFIDPLESLIQNMADVCDLPANRFHRGGQTPSADSQRLDERPLEHKTKDRQDQFGVTWHEFYSYVCLVAGLGETDARPAWAPPEVYNDKASWEAAQLQLSIGVPFKQVLIERGYVGETVDEWERELPGGVPPFLVKPAVPPLGDGTSAGQDVAGQAVTA